MIYHITGKILSISEKFVVIETGGLGYQVYVSTDTLQSLSDKKGEVCSLWTHMHVREDAMDLFGFIEEDEKKFFEMLISISGIGPRGALGILSIAPIETLKRAIASGDTSYLTKISGIGRKTAEKIVIELRDKLASLGHRDEDGSHKDEIDALEGLKSLGYSQNEARDALKAVSPDIIGTSARIKEALKNLSNK